jgi:hypothetical protein
VGDEEARIAANFAKLPDRAANIPSRLFPQLLRAIP